MSSVGESLFGHLVTRFSTHPENLATEALVYVAEHSLSVRACLGRLPLSFGALGCTDGTWFSSQALGVDGGIPDVVGLDPAGKPQMLLEAKFWAEMTNHQPITYLHRLDAGRALVFVVPARRVDWVWGELERRCAAAGLPFVDAWEGTETRSATVDRRVLTVMSWPSLLNLLIVSATVAADTNAVSDLRQLDGLCAEMDTSGFVPFSADEFTTSWARRVLDLCDLVDLTQQKILNDGDADVVGLRPGNGYGYYGRYIRVSEAVIFLAFNASKWRDLAATPLWVDSGSMFTPGEREGAFAPLELQRPQGAFRYQGVLTVPVWIPPNRERDQVITDIADQVRAAAALLTAARRDGSAEVQRLPTRLDTL